MLATVNPIPGESYNIGGTYSCTVGEMLDFLISLSTDKDHIKVQQDTERLRPLDADLQVPDTSKFKAHTYGNRKYLLKKQWPTYSITGGKE